MWVIPILLSASNPKINASYYAALFVVSKFILNECNNSYFLVDMRTTPTLDSSLVEYPTKYIS